MYMIGAFLFEGCTLSVIKYFSWNVAGCSIRIIQKEMAVTL